MQSFDPPVDSPRRWWVGAGRGLFLGFVAVLATALWAVNIEIATQAEGAAGITLAIVLLIFCDVVPFVIILTLYRCLDRGLSVGDSLREIGRSLVWFLPKPGPSSDRDNF